MRTLLLKFLLASFLFIPLWGGAQQSGLEDARASTEEETETALRKELVDEYYEKIRDLKFDFGKMGNVFSAVASLELREEFKGQDFEILNGIDFQDLDGKKVGVPWWFGTKKRRRRLRFSWSKPAPTSRGL